MEEAASFAYEYPHVWCSDMHRGHSYVHKLHSEASFVHGAAIWTRPSDTRGDGYCKKMGLYPRSREKVNKCLTRESGITPFHFPWSHVMAFHIGESLLFANWQPT